MVDFMFGKPVSMVSTAANEDLRRTIERVLDKVWEQSGGIALLQDAALLGHVFGHVDLLLRIDEDGLRSAIERTPSANQLDRAPRCRRIPSASKSSSPAVASPSSTAGLHRNIAAYIINYDRDLNCPQRPGLLERLIPRDS